jgi:cardiolipin synthase
MSDAKEKIVNAPNSLTVFRLVLFGGFCVLILTNESKAIAAVLLGFAGITDFLDGYVARHFNQVTELGKIIDPVADRILVGGSLVVALISHSIPLVIGLIIIFREVLMSTVTVVLAMLRAKRIDVIWFGKAGTFVLMVAIPLMILTSYTGSHVSEIKVVFNHIGLYLSLVGIVMSYTATVMYIPISLKALDERSMN